MRWGALTNQISYLLLILILLLILLIFLIRSEPAINNHHSDLCKDEVAYTRAWNHNTLAAEGRAAESKIEYIEVIIRNQVFEVVERDRVGHVNNIATIKFLAGIPRKAW